MTPPLPSELRSISALVPGLAQVLGDRCEVVLHDFRNPKRSLVAIAGNLTGRQVGAPMTDRLLETYRTYGDAAQDLIGIPVRTKEGRLWSSSTIFVRDASGRIIGSLGINLDLTEMEMAHNVIGNILGRITAEPRGEQAIHFATSIDDLMNDLIDRELTNQGPSPQLLDRNQRLDVVRALEGHGLFQIKGSVDELAKRLGVSRFTVYGYVEAVREADKATGT